MGQAIIRVDNRRIRFKCSFCQKRTTLSIPPNVCRKTITCFSCGEIIPCKLNRRIELRRKQSGKALLVTSEGQMIDVDLLDISSRGVGFNVAPKDMSRVTVGGEVNLRCAWNPRMFSRENYVIRSVIGRRVGAQSFQ